MRWKSALFLMLVLAGAPVYGQGPYGAGEKVTYSIKKFGVKAGQATLVYNGLTEWRGRQVMSITFTATALNFLDREEIFCDPQTYYPLQVKRNLNIWGKKEVIIEEYRAGEGKVLITKKTGGRTVKSVIRKDGPLENIYCFLYRARKEGRFLVGQTFALNLPTAAVTLRIVRKEEIRTGGGVHEAYYMESGSGEYRLWFGDDPRRIPLRIDGAIGLGSASLIMSAYEPPVSQDTDDSRRCL